MYAIRFYQHLPIENILFSYSLDMLVGMLLQLVKSIYSDFHVFNLSERFLELYN